MAYAGKNGYDVNKDELDSFIHLIRKWLNHTNESDTLDLSFGFISLYQVGKILEYFGYENYDISHNGWQMDYWWKYILVDKNKSPTEFPKIVQISGSGADGSMVLSICKEGE